MAKATLVRKIPGEIGIELRWSRLYRKESWLRNRSTSKHSSEKSGSNFGLLPFEVPDSALDCTT